MKETHPAQAAGALAGPRSRWRVTRHRLRTYRRLGSSPDAFTGDGRPGRREQESAGSSPDGRPGRAVLASRYEIRPGKPASGGRRETRSRSHDARADYPVPLLRPPGSGSDGYVCGRIAAYLDGQVTVTLQPKPPPLATPMAVEQGGESSVRIHHGRTLIAEATSSSGARRWRYRARSLNGGSSHGGKPRPLLLRSGLPCLLCLRDGPRKALGTGCGSSPDLWLAGRCKAARRGHRIPRSPTSAGGSGRRWSGRRWIVPAGSPREAESADLAQDTAILLGRMTASLWMLPAVATSTR